MITSLAIVIPSHDRFEVLATLLSQLRKQVVSDLKYFIIVVADSSKLNYAKQIGSAFPDVHMVNGTGDWWFTRSVNEGIKNAELLKASHVLILNDDCEIEDDYLKNMLQAEHEYPSAVIGSACFNNSDRNVLLFSGIKDIKWYRMKLVRYHKPFQKIDRSSFHGLHNSNALNGRGMLIPLSVIKRTGYFDERFIQYQSDFVFCYKARKENIPVYISWDAKVYDNIHLTNGTQPYLKKSVFSFLRSFADPHSVNYFPSTVRIINSNVKLLVRPMAFCFYILGNIKANFFKYNSIKKVLD